MTAYTWMRDAEILNRYGFQGKEWESKTQWYDFHAKQYDPVLGRWFALDPANQFASGYMGMGNNPIMGIDPDGNFFWIIPQISYSKEGGLSIGISVVFGIPGGASAQVGVGYNFKSKDWSAYAAASLAFNTVSLSYSSGSGWNAGYTLGFSPYSGVPVSSNLFTVGVNYNISHNEFGGNLSAMEFDTHGNWTYNPGVTAMIAPERTTNLVRGKGFKTNNQVLARFVAKNDHDGALKYFGFKGKYDPSVKSGDFQADDYWGTADSKTGEITYGNRAFKDYPTLLGTYIKERYTLNVKSGRGIDQLPEEWRGYNSDTYLEEVNAYIYAWKRRGLFTRHSIPFDGIKLYQGRLYLFGIKYSEYPKNFTYSIPRKY